MLFVVILRPTVPVLRTIRPVAGLQTYAVSVIALLFLIKKKKVVRTIFFLNLKQMHTSQSLFFFQNGASKPLLRSSILDGQGHVTAIHIASGEVSELIVPAPRIRISLQDIMQRNFVRWLFGVFCLGAIHTGTANTAVMKTNLGLLAVEEGSKPFRLSMCENKLVSGKWLFDSGPMGVHPNSVESYSYRPFRQFPLWINGMPVQWNPSSFPILVHSVSRLGDHVIVPLISTHIGGFFEYVIGMRKFPITEHHAFQWLLYNQTSKKASIIDTDIFSNPLHIVKTKYKDNDTLEIYACHVRDFSHIVETGTDDAVSPNFEFRKDTISLSNMTLICSHIFSDAYGDFPNTVNESVVLINSLHNDGRNQSIKFFDTDIDEIVDEIELPPDVRDVLYYDGHLFYCTLDVFYIYNIDCRKIVRHIDIPVRSTNFHASLISIPPDVRL